jgi:hypothetical protein
MGRMIPLGQIPKTSILPEGIARVRVKKMEATTTKGSDDKPKKLMYKLVGEVVEPESHAGLGYFNQFVIGSDDDPMADELATWQKSYGSRDLRSLSEACNVGFGDEENDETFCATLVGAEFLAKIVQKIDDGKKNPDYKGNVRNETKGFFPIGKYEPVFKDDAGN